VYLTKDGRISMAGVTSGNVRYEKSPGEISVLTITDILQRRFIKSPRDPFGYSAMAKSNRISFRLRLLITPYTPLVFLNTVVNKVIPLSYPRSLNVA
jgi:hypothetical protein